VLHCIIGGSVYAAGVMFFGLLTPALIPVAGALTSCFHVSLRRGLKRHHGIEDGSGCCENDWVLAVCCDPCAVCQEQREIDLRRPQIMHPGGMMPPPMMMMNPMMMPPQPGQYMPPGQPAMRPMQPMAPQPYGQPGFAQGGMTPMPQAGVPVYQATVQPPQQPVAVAGYAPAYPTNPDKY
jgi:Cys-rich protein (TIGR01571 family)